MRDNQTKTLHLAVDKKDSSFIYFTLESNEGLGFYSTLQHQEGAQERVIELTYHISLEREILSTLKHLKSNIDLDIKDLPVI